MKTAVLLLSVLPSVLGTGFGLLRVGGGSAAERAVRSQEFGLSRRDKAAQSALRELMYLEGAAMSMSMSMLTSDSSDGYSPTREPLTLAPANATTVTPVNSTETPSVAPSSTPTIANATVAPIDSSTAPSDAPSSVPTASPTVANDTEATSAPTGTDEGAAGANAGGTNRGGANNKAEAGKTAVIVILVVAGAAVAAALVARKMHKRGAASGNSMSDSSDSAHDAMA